MVGLGTGGALVDSLFRMAEAADLLVASLVPALWPERTLGGR